MEFTFSNRRWILKDEPENVKSDFALGLHISGRYDKILNINNCHIQKDAANEILNIVKQYSSGMEPYDILEHKGFLRNLMIRHAENTNEIMVNIVTAFEDTEKLITLTGADGDADVEQILTFVLTGLPTNGSLSQSSGGSVIASGDLPLDLNFPLVDCGKIPRCPKTGILFLPKCSIIFLIFFPPSNLTPSHLVSFITFLQFLRASDLVR